MQSVMDLARLDINDAAKVRNPDANVIKFLNDGIAKVYVLRPDLNWGNYANAYVDLSTAANFPLPLEYRAALVDYIVLRCETSDDPFAVEQRAAQSLVLFMRDLGFK